MQGVPAGRREKPGISDLIGDVYAIGIDRGNWGVLLERLCSVTGSKMAIVASYDLTDRSTRIHKSINIPAAYLRTYVERYATCDAWAHCDGDSCVAGTVSIDDSARAEQPATAALYQAWLRPQDIRYLLRAVIDYEDRETAPRKRAMVFLTIGREQGKGPFRDDDVARIEALMPHLQQAHRIGELVADLRQRKDACMDALDLIPLGVVLLDRHRRVVTMNRCALEIVVEDNGKTPNLAALLAPVGGAPGRVAMWADGARECSAIPWQADGNAVALITRASQLRPLIAAVRVRQKAVQSGDGDTAVVFLSDPERMTGVDEAALRRLYGLTRAEAHIAALLAEGLHVDEAAERLKISINTARTHVKHVLSKTHSQRQSDLMRLLLDPCTHIRR